MDGFKRLIGVETKEPSLWEQAEKDCCCTLSTKQRFIGFGICFGVGLLCTFLSAIFGVPQLVIAPEKFAILYTLGNILSLGSTAFLVGPLRQIKNMFAPVRLSATIIYLVAMGLTLFAAFKAQSVLLVLLFVFIQFCALIWVGCFTFLGFNYAASYVPYGRSILSKCVSGMV